MLDEESEDGPRRSARIMVRAMSGDGDLQDLSERDRLEVEGWRKHWKELESKRAERAARPIPNTPFVDIYDARRLLAPTKVTANAWIRQGRLTRNVVDGCVQISRSEIDAILTEVSSRPRRGTR